PTPTRGRGSGRRREAAARQGDPVLRGHGRPCRRRRSARRGGRGVTLEGVDVSHWQSVYPVKGISFVFVKASEGTAADPKYGVHALRATTAGLHLGAYHFCRNDVDIDAQAAFFVAHGPAAQALALDVEG